MCVQNISAYSAQQMRMDAWGASVGSAPRSPGMIAVAVPKRFFKPTVFQVMFANERMIGVAARWDHCALDLVVAHAPCNARHSAGNTRSENREWWRKLVREVRRTHSSKGSLVWMLDASGKVGSHECNAIGSYAAEKENDNGMLRTALMEFDMLLPAMRSVNAPKMKTISGPGHQLLARLTSWTMLH